MSSHIFWVVVVPVVTAIAVQVLILVLQRRPRFQRLRVDSRVWLSFRILAFAAIAFYLVVLGVGPKRFWDWYSSPIATPARDFLIAIAAIAITAWTGCLIAFAVRQRLTPDLSRGLRFMIYACFTPLVALPGSGTALRTVAFVAAIYWGLWARFSFVVRRGKRSSLIFM